MSKRVLVLWWSQSGQLAQVSETFLKGLQAEGHEVCEVELRPLEPYPFPWTVTRFFGTFPETVLERPIALAPVEIPDGDWDLVVVAAQVWFLSPSPPFTAFLQSPAAGVLKDRRVLTLVACRNMWVVGWRKLVRRIRDVGGRVTDRVVVTHGGSPFASYFTTLSWMLTGRRDALKVLPKAGIEPEVFDRLEGWGRLAGRRLEERPPHAPLLDDETTASISHTHALGEQVVSRIFPVQARVAATLSRPGTRLRAVFAVAQFAFILSSVLLLFLPFTLLRGLFRRRIDPWLDRLGRLPTT